MESILSPPSLLTLSTTLGSSDRTHLNSRLLFSTNSPLIWSSKVLNRRKLAAVELSKSLRTPFSVGPSAGSSGAGAEIGGSSGGDGSEGGDSKVGAMSTDVIMLDVRGMTCGGCAASVKRILESQPQVSSADVNLATETAIAWPASEAKTLPNWQKELGEMLAKQLTTCGFESNLQGQVDKEGDGS